MSRFLLLLLLSTIVFSACRDDLGESLFELNYPAHNFNLPAGLNSNLAYVQAINNIPTNYPDFVMTSGHSPDEVNKIVPQFARIISQDGLDFGFLSSVSVRICPTTQTDCTFADEVFYLDDLYRRNITTLNLNPGLGNVQSLLTGSLYKLEVVFFPGEITPFSVDCRLEYSFEAFQ